MLRVIPPPVTVIVPLLNEVLVFCVALIRIVPLFSPLSGVTVSHEGSLLLAVHDIFDITEIFVLDASEVGFQLVPGIDILATA